MSNREYKSDAQTEYDRNRYIPDYTSEVIENKSNLETSVSEGVSFCPNCGSMMLPRDGFYECRCGYSSDNRTANNSNRSAKSKTFLELNVKTHNLKINNRLFVSGYLGLKNDYVLVNAEIEIYFAGKYLKSVFTDGEGYYQFAFQVNKTGRQEILAAYRGSSEFEMSTATDHVNVTGRKANVYDKPIHDDDFIARLEKLVSFYERGLLTDEEFTKMKRKLIME